MRKNLSNKPFTFAIGSTNVLVTTQYNTAVTAFGTTKAVQIGQKTHKIADWGDNNNAPLQRQKLVYDNNVVGQSLKTARNAILGNRIYPFQWQRNPQTQRIERVEILPSELDTQIAAFFDRNDYSNALLLAAGDLVLNAQFTPQYTRLTGDVVKNNPAIHEMKLQRALYMRSGETTTTGEAANWYLNGSWGGAGFKAEDTVVIPYHDPQISQNTFVKRFGDPFLTDNAYYLPTWEGSRWWIELANLIPQYHIANLKKGWFPRWHIEIPDGFFDDPKLYPDVDALTDVEFAQYEAFIQAARLAFQTEMKGALGGYENASGVIITDYQLDELKSKLPIGVQITALKAEIHHEAYVALFDASNTAIISAQGMSPEIAGVQTAHALAGANYREALQLYQILQLPVQQNMILDAFFRLPTRWNGWTHGGKPIEWAIENVSLLTQDTSKTGDTTS